MAKHRKIRTHGCHTFYLNDQFWIDMHAKFLNVMSTTSEPGFKMDAVFTKHKALILEEYGKPLVSDELVTPTPRGEEVLLKTISVGICHSDVHLWKGEIPHSGSLPMVLGHEIVGTVVAKGDKVPDSVKKGDAVLFYFGIYTEEDKYTRKGLTQHAKTWRPWGGGLQEYILVPHHRFLVNVDGLEDIPAAAPLSCAAITAYGAVKKIRHDVEPDEYVAIIGLGGLGIFAAQWVKIFLPYANLIGIDVKEEALRFSSSIVKIDAFINASKEDPIETIKNVTRGEGVRAVIDFVGDAKTVGTYINALSPLGIYILVGLMGAELTLPSSFVLSDSELQIRGNKLSSLSDLYEIVEFARRKRLNYSAVVTKRCRFDVEQVNKTFKEFEEGKVVGRQIVTFS